MLIRDSDFDDLAGLKDQAMADRAAISTTVANVAAQLARLIPEDMTVYGALPGSNPLPFDTDGCVVRSRTMSWKDAGRTMTVPTITIGRGFMSGCVYDARPAGQRHLPVRFSSDPDWQQFRRPSAVAWVGPEEERLLAVCLSGVLADLRAQLEQERRASQDSKDALTETAGELAQLASEFAGSESQASSALEGSSRRRGRLRLAGRRRV